MWNLLYKFVVWFLYPDLQIFTRAYLDFFNEIFYTGEIWVLSKKCILELYLTILMPQN